MAQGSQGPRTYRFSAQRVRATRRRKPGEELWAVWRRNRDGSEPRYYRSNAPEDTTLETLAYVGGSRWRIEMEFETEKGDVGLDEYETRSWAGWHHHIAMCLLGGAFLLSLQQDWGEKDAPDHEATGVPGGAGDAAPGAVRARSIAVVAGGYAATQRTGSPFPRETPLHPPRRQDGAATLTRRCSTRTVLVILVALFRFSEEGKILDQAMSDPFRPSVVDPAGLDHFIEEVLPELVAELPEGADVTFELTRCRSGR